MKKGTSTKQKAGNGIKRNVSSRLLVVSIATGSRDVETWGFDDPVFCEKFCRQLVADTGKTAIVIEGGRVKGKYSMEFPVVYKENGC